MSECLTDAFKVWLVVMITIAAWSGVYAVVLLWIIILRMKKERSNAK
jgi:hypothetical protein